jgi:ABC-2 type transport system ATP-binding protein
MKFSSGMKRKLDLARSMLSNPDIYILDEPTNGIDPISQDVIRKIIFDLKKEGKTILLITHNLHEANLLCDRVGILDKGVLVWEGSINDFEKHKELSILDCSYDSDVSKEEVISKLLDLSIVKRVSYSEEIDKSFKIFFSKKNGALDILLKNISLFNFDTTRISLITPTIEDIFREFVKNNQKDIN